MVCTPGPACCPTHKRKPFTHEVIVCCSRDDMAKENSEHDNQDRLPPTYCNGVGREPHKVLATAPPCSPSQETEPLEDRLVKEVDAV